MTSQIINVEIKYELGHTYKEQWAPSGYCCPSCGGRQTWEEQGVGDYEQGSQFLCAECEAEFYLPAGAGKRDSWQNKQRLEAIRFRRGTQS
jgi:hypothetical protein